jgi:Mg2+ and Co2+ transporter CorA
MAIKALLYSADAPDQEPDLAAMDVARLTERELLWVDLASPDEAEIAQVAGLIGVEPRLLALGPGKHARPRLSNYGHQFRLTATTVSLSGAGQKAEPLWMTLVAGPNYVVSVHAGGVEFVDELREREKGDTGIGALSAESFVASLLDWLLNSYFQALELVVREIDRVEVAVLSHRDPSTIAHQVELLIQARRRVAEIRRLLISHRDVFYGLARPDFMATEKPETRPHFIALNARLERAEDDVDHARELVVGAFDLLSTRAAQKTNDTMRALTFATVLLGSLALVAGVMGMNFQLAFFESGQKGFLIVTGAMFAASVAALLIAWWRKWI